MSWSEHSIGEQRAKLTSLKEKYQRLIFMAIKTYRPITPSLRFKTTLTNDELTTDKPHKPLTRIKLRTGGRRNAGDITIWHRGGGHKRKLRAIDFKRDKNGVPATVVSDRVRS